MKSHQFFLLLCLTVLVSGLRPRLGSFLDVSKESECNKLATRDDCLALKNLAGTKQSTSLGPDKDWQGCQWNDKERNGKKCRMWNGGPPISDPSTGNYETPAFHENLAQYPNLASNVKAVIRKAEDLRPFFATFFVTDSVSFPGNAKHGFSPVKPGIVVAVNQQQENSVPIAMQSGVYDTCVTAGNKVYENRIGSCGTLALAMFAKLAPTEDTVGPRIELICVGSGTSGTHCFLVVGRDAGAAGVRPNMFNKGGSFPTADSWGTAAVVIDPWLMALGHDGINLSPKDGPRVLPCNSNLCKTQYPCANGEQTCFSHGESLGFNGGKLFLEKALVN